MNKVIVDLDKLKDEIAFYVEQVCIPFEGNAISIPKEATNGSMINAMFPDAKFDNAMPFTDGRWETMNLDTENRTRATYKPTQLRTYADWWNASYTLRK